MLVPSQSSFLLFRSSVALGIWADTFAAQSRDCRRGSRSPGPWEHTVTVDPGPWEHTVTVDPGPWEHTVIVDHLAAGNTQL